METKTTQRGKFIKWLAWASVQREQARRIQPLKVSPNNIGDRVKSQRKRELIFPLTPCWARAQLESLAKI